MGNLASGSLVRLLKLAYELSPNGPSMESFRNFDDPSVCLTSGVMQKLMRKVANR